MSSLFELLFKKPLFVGAVALILGIIIGIPIGWNTVTVVNTTPDVLRFDLQEDYLRMAIDSFGVNPDPNLAVQRWNNLGAAAAPAFSDIQKNPGKMNPAVIRAIRTSHSDGADINFCKYGKTIRQIPAGRVSF